MHACMGIKFDMLISKGVTQYTIPIHSNSLPLQLNVCLETVK